MELVGLREAAAILGWDPRRVSVYLQRGKLPAPAARLVSGPVWYTRTIEAFARGEDTRAWPIPKAQVRAILWAHFEAARLGLLRPPEYGDPLPWTIDGKPPGFARSLQGLSFPVAYRELWPAFAKAALAWPDLAALLQDEEALWRQALRLFDQVRSQWELQAVVNDNNDTGGDHSER